MFSNFFNGKAPNNMTPSITSKKVLNSTTSHLFPSRSKNQASKSNSPPRNSDLTLKGIISEIQVLRQNHEIRNHSPRSTNNIRIDMLTTGNDFRAKNQSPYIKNPTTKIIVKAPTSQNIENKLEKNPFMVSALKSSPRSLVSKIQHPIKANDSQTLLKTGEMPISTTEKSKINLSFLMAAKNNKTDLCLELLQNKQKSYTPSVDTCDANGWSALHFGCLNKNLSLVKLLITSGAKVDLEDKNYVTPLMIASAQNSFEIVEVLLNSGSNHKLVDSKLNTPLHYAIAGNSLKCAEILLRKNSVQSEAKNRDGKTAFDMIRTSEMKNLVERVKEEKKKSQEQAVKVIIQTANLRSEDTEKKNDSPRNLTQQDTASSIPSAEKLYLDDFVIQAQLGKGSFGEVFLVRKKNTKSLFAMKVLDKIKMNKLNLLKYAKTERNVLSVIYHPFIVKLEAAFQSQDKLFLVLEYCPGGDLDYHLQREKCFTEDRARVYLAEILLAIEELHKKDIIYRDLKPENVVLDAEGHALLTDFGLSKEEVCENACGARSFCGSVAYLAPEMLKRVGHGKAVDWYLLGVLLHEMLVGQPPYFAESREEIFFNIEHAPLNLSKAMSEEARSLIRNLMERNPLKRLGSGSKDADEIKNHPFFKTINWNNVFQRKYELPKYLKPVKMTAGLNYQIITFKVQDEKEKVSGWSFVQQNQSNH